MKDRIYRYIGFVPFDRDGTVKKLEAMAAKGYLLEDMGMLLWRFRKDAPRKVRYAVKYDPDLSLYGPDAAGMEEGSDMGSAESDWQQVCSWGKVMIFSSERSDLAPFVSDEAAELDALKHSMNRSYLPSLAIMLAVIVFLFCQDTFSDPAAVISSYPSLLLKCTAAFACLMLVISAAAYFLWLRRAERAVRCGEAPAPTEKYAVPEKISSVLVLALFVIYILSLLVSGDKSLAFWTGAYLVIFLIAASGLRKLTRKLKSAGMSKGKSLALVILFMVVLWVVLTALLIGMDFLWSPEDGSSETPSGMPLTLEELTGRSADASGNPTQIWNSSGTFIMGMDTGDIRSDDLTIMYEVVHVKKGALYDLCLRKWKKQGGSLPVSGIEGGYRKCAVEEISAEGVYRYYYDDDIEPDDQWLLCYPDRIIRVWMPGGPTGRQWKLIDEKLRTY